LNVFCSSLLKMTKASGLLHLLLLTVVVRQCHSVLTEGLCFVLLDLHLRNVRSRFGQQITESKLRLCDCNSGPKILPARLVSCDREVITPTNAPCICKVQTQANIHEIECHPSHNPSPTFLYCRCSTRKLCCSCTVLILVVTYF